MPEFETRWVRKEKILARLAKLPALMKAELESALKTEVDDLVEAQRRAAPVSALEDHAGQFRDSIHAYKNPDRPLSYRVLADARDAHGEFIGPHIEFGHHALDGTHVDAVPSFFPTYRARKKPMRRRLGRAAGKAARAAFNEGS